MKKLILLVVSIQMYAGPTTFQLSSPDKNINVTINTGEITSYKVSFKGKEITKESQLSMTLGDGKILGVKTGMPKIMQRSVNQDVKPLFGMATTYKDVFNEISLVFKDYNIVFKAFNNGVAYRFETKIKGNIKVNEEQISYKFPTDVKGSLHKVSGFLNSYEENYVDDKISFLDSGKIATLPLLAESNGIKVCITEVDLFDYAAFYLSYDGNNGLKGVLPKVVTKDSIGGCCPNFERLPFERANYLAITNGTRTFPWRLMVLAEQDKDLLYNNLTYLLAQENKIGDASWVKPGKVSWDWWNANNLTGVDFVTGYNTNTYKYFIDFAAKNGIEYINMDEGWSDQFDLLKLNDGKVKIGTNPSLGGGLDMPYLFNYAKSKNVGIMLWCVWHVLDRQMNVALDQFEKWGVKALKVDFMDRDDQNVVNFYEKLAIEAAKRKMLVLYHGAYKPTGMERTYPNVINREAVQGLEYNKFTNSCTPENLAHIPFIRMVAGPMDYTPGAMTNANEGDFKSVQARPMSQGTRCNQLALFTVLYAPLEMLADAPTAYEKEPVILEYLSKMPTVWDETMPIDGKIGDFAVVARRKGTTWHVAGVSDWTGRKVKVKFDFLSIGKYNAEIFSDGLNANRNGNDYKKTTQTITKGEELTIEMASGGGFAIKLTPLE
ncbi:MAG: glycoside hydrolase family 97 protein [Bacteroidetes bacterium]|nr:MAG: glycoside hydrolase family 97 protein [Bacteroidota bacterium]